MKRGFRLLQWLKALGIALLVTLIGTALLALVLKNNPKDQLISALAVLVKAVSVIFGTFALCRALRRKGALCGGGLGLLYGTVCFLLVILLEGTGGVTLFSFLDVLLTALFGVFSGVLTVNLLR